LPRPATFENRGQREYYHASWCDVVFWVPVTEPMITPRQMVALDLANEDFTWKDSAPGRSFRPVQTGDPDEIDTLEPFPHDQSHHDKIAVVSGGANGMPP